MNDRIKIAFLIFGGVLVIGLFGLIKKVKLSTKASVIVKQIFVCLCFLLFTTFILSLLGIYFRGFWTTKIIIWTFILTASLFYSYGNRQIVTKPWKKLTALIFYFPLASILLLALPTFLGTIGSYAIWLRLTGDPKAIYYNDNEVRIQKLCSDCNAGFMGDPRYFKKEGMFEFDKGYLRTSNNTFDDTIKIEKKKDSVIVYLYYTNQEAVAFKFKR